jgi:hypothetical protein
MLGETSNCANCVCPLRGHHTLSQQCTPVLFAIFRATYLHVSPEGPLYSVPTVHTCAICYIQSYIFACVPWGATEYIQTNSAHLCYLLYLELHICVCPGVSTILISTSAHLLRCCHPFACTPVARVPSICISIEWWPVCSCGNSYNAGIVPTSASIQCKVIRCHQ